MFMIIIVAILLQLLHKRFTFMLAKFNSDINMEANPLNNCLETLSDQIAVVTQIFLGLNPSARL